MTRLACMFAVGLSAALAAPAASADEPGPGGRATPADGRRKRADARPQARGDRTRGRAADAAPAGAVSTRGAAPDPQIVTRIQQRAAANRAKRAERARLMRNVARRRMSVILSRADAAERAAVKREVTRAFARHARRMARLNRLLLVTATSGDAAAMRQVDALLARENARHNRWMASVEATPGHAIGKGGAGRAEASRAGDRADARGER